MQRSIEFIWWLYPILWLFWPSQLSCRKKREALSNSSHDRGSRHNKNRDQGSGRGNDDESDNDVPYDESSGNSYALFGLNSTGTAMFGGTNSNNSQTFLLLPNAVSNNQVTPVPKSDNSFNTFNSMNNKSSENDSSQYHRHGDGTFKTTRSPDFNMSTSFS